MSDILSTAELDALIDAFREPDGQAAAPRVDQSMDSQGPKLNDAQLAGLRAIHGSFAWGAEAAFSDVAGLSANIRLVRQDQVGYAEFVEQNASSVISIVAAPPLKGRILLAMPYPLIHLVLSARFGNPLGTSNRTNFNEIELSVLRDLMERVMAGYAESWRQIARLKTSVKAIEHWPGKTQVAMPSDHVLAAILEIRIGTVTEHLSICIPNQVLKPFLAQVIARRLGQRDRIVAPVIELNDSVTASIYASVPNWKSRGVEAGAIIPLKGGGTFDIYDGATKVGTGELAVVDGVVVIRVVEGDGKRRGSKPQAA